MNKKPNKQKSEITKNSISSFNFSAEPIKLPTEVAKRNRNGSEIMQYWGGQANDYPAHLNKLYAKCAIHAGIIKTKKNYILGDKIIYKNTGEIADFMLNDEENISTFLGKIVEEFLIYNIFAVEVLYNASGSPVEWNFIPAKFLRTNKAKSKFWYSTEWNDKSSPSIVQFDGWKTNQESGYESKIFWYCGYNAGKNEIYHEPEYFGAQKAIETAISISDFHHNNINTNFSASSVLTFFNGEPTDEVRKEIENTITQSYTGTTGKKLIINYANEDSKSTEITNISPSEWNDAFLTLKESVIEDIVIAHSITSSMLIGMKSEGQLGGASEQDSSFKIFKSQYVNKKRDEILKQLNKLFKGIFNEIDIVDEEEIKELESSVLVQIMTIDELRKSQGLKPLPNNTGNRLINDIPNVTAPTIPSNTNQEFSTAEENDELLFQSIQEFGIERDDFIMLRRHAFNSQMQFDSDNRLTNYLITNAPFAGKTLKDIQSDLDGDYTIQDIKKELAKLIASNIIDKSNLINENELKQAQKEAGITSNTPNSNKIEVRYSYEGAIDDKNRPFCAKLVRANKLYTRNEIEMMSEALGYQIFIHKGGKNCRHSWVAHTVIQKTK